MARATDVQRRVSNHQNLLAAQRPSKTLAAPPVRHRGDLVTLLVVVGKTAKRKFIPKVETFQFDARSFFDVAGEQTDQRRLGLVLQGSMEFQHAWAGAAPAIRDQFPQPAHVGRKETLEMPRRWLDLVPGEDFTNKRNIGSARELHSLSPIVYPKFAGESPRKRLDSRAAGMDKRSVNIK